MAARHVVIGTAGHIDHGKSALIRALTGTDPDRLKEEKARGITIDLGFAYLQLGAAVVDFVDVPGHERFVKNMLAGATGIDGVLLVVAADESVMPQTREHFDICRLLRVRRGVIALTKSDLADASMRELVRMEVRELVAGSFLAAAPLVEVSAVTGEGLEALRVALRDLAATVPDRTADGAARLPVDRVFSVRGFGTVVTGTVVAGTIAVDDALVVLPGGQPVKVRGLQAHGSAVAGAGAGQRLAVNLAGVEVGDLARGVVLARPGTLAATRRFDASVEVIAGTRPLRHGARVRLHQGTAEVLGRIALSRVVAAHTSAGPPVPAEVPPGARAHVRLRLEGPAVVTRGDRFILRAYSPPVTIAGGIVLDPHPPRGPIRTAAAHARFDRLEFAEDAPRGPAPALDAAVRHLVEERGAAGLARGELVSRAGLGPSRAVEMAAALEQGGVAVGLGDALVAAAALETLGSRVLALLAEHHAAEPASEGVPREEVRVRLFGRAHPGAFEHVVERLVAGGRIVARERLALAGHQLAFSDETRRALGSVERICHDAGLRPPDPAALAAATGLSPQAVDEALRVLTRQKTLVKLGALWFHGEALARLREEIVAMRAGGRTVELDVATFKQRYDVSRKYAIPLLEYLDRERVTRRVGEVRIVV
jgi:selenocysteine-specific elongation factor